MTLALWQVSVFLSSKAWDTRAAAGECLGQIAEHCKHHTPQDLRQAVPNQSASTSSAAHANPAKDALDSLLSLAGFSIKEVLDKGTPLLASAGQVWPAACTTPAGGGA